MCAENALFEFKTETLQIAILLQLQQSNNELMLNLPKVSTP